MNFFRKCVHVLLAAGLLSVSPAVYADNNVLQNQAAEGSTINQNIVFVDVKNHWANDAIYDMTKKGIISGYEDSSFQPEKSITRQEFAKLIALTFYLPLQNPGSPTYSDVNKDRWSYSYIESTKEYLTGYFPPRGGKAFFSPDTQATREDVAVALVKVLGFSTSDLKNPDSLSYKFKDVNDISYSLRDYVALATEKQLISGYEDRTFRPEKPITRAEVATLLYRVIKSSSQDQTDGPQLAVSVPDTTDNGTVYVSGTTHRDAKVSINGTKIPVEDGAFKEGIALKEEGTHTITVAAALPSGKTTTVRKTVIYKTSGPVIKLEEVPDTAASEQITISGKIIDPTDYNPTLYINGEKEYMSGSGGDFARIFFLEEGENVFTFKVVNRAGKEAVATKTVVFNADAPLLKINTFSGTADKETITVSGTVTDRNDNFPTVTVNNRTTHVSGGSFTSYVDLEEGENTITFKAENSKGKVTTITKTVIFEASAPVIKLSYFPENTTAKSVNISGTVTDKNDRSPSVYINDRKIYISGSSFSEDITLRKGANPFTIVAANSYGKTSTVTKTVYYND